MLYEVRSLGDHLNVYIIRLPAIARVQHNIIIPPRMILLTLISVCSVYAHPVNLAVGAPATNVPAFYVSPAGSIGLLWSSIGIAVLTSFLQGLAVTVVSIAEDQEMWTFRFRIARYEYLWWTVISSMLSVSFILIVVSFLSGNSSDSLGVLVLSTTTSIAIVRYTIPAWRNKPYVKTRWLSWTGVSRTAIKVAFGTVVGDADWWRQLAARAPPASRRIVLPSDEWGWAINPPPGVSADPTALLTQSLLDDNKEASELPLASCIYDDGYHHAGGAVSLLWGPDIGFRPRLSRAINSVPRSLTDSRPITNGGYKGEGLCLAMGILGRNKGLRPFLLVFDHKDTRKKQRGIVFKSDMSITAHLENTSIWYPRPSKVLRSYYEKEIVEQFGGLGDDYVGAATELAVLLLDCSPSAVVKWLSLGLDQQSLEVNMRMSGRHSRQHDTVATPAQLQTLYRASYTSMILSLNYFTSDPPDGNFVRPDLICFALLWLAEGAVEESEVSTDSGGKKKVYSTGKGAEQPEWWKQPWVGERLKLERQSLDSANTEWRNAAACLLGLTSWPEHLDFLTDWESVIYTVQAEL
ncbi:hypothetical protein L208DRAFT_1395035 [Tricholoma matsutake]|nr:hypothetical protein L208DRAFT_1395035 [Tricholoma matsutake 945]